MIKFNFKKLLFEELISLPELAEQTKIKYSSLTIMKRRGTVKPEVFRQIKKKYPNANQYIQNNKSGYANGRYNHGASKRSSRNL